MHAEALQRLSQGFTTMIAKAGDFQYSYLLWFEDIDGTRLDPQRVRTDSVHALFAESLQELQPSSNPVGTQFYSDMVQQLFPTEKPGSVYCYELYMIHLALVPIELAMAQGHDLVNELRRT